MKKQNNVISLYHVLQTLINQKILIIIITLCFVSYQYYNFQRDKGDEIYNMGTAAIINKQPKSTLLNFVNSNLVFYNSYKRDLDTIMQIELDLYENILLTNFISTDNFLSFLKKTNNQDLFDQIIKQKDKSQNIFVKRLGILSRSTENSELKQLREIDIPIDKEITYFIHKSNIDGRKILNDYLNSVNKQTHDLYFKQKYQEFNLILDRFIMARRIAEKLNIKIPSFSYPELESALKQFQIDNLAAITGDSLYLKGTDILDFEIEDMEKKLIKLNEFKFDFNLILDTPFIFYANKKPIKKTSTVIIRSLLSGLFLSLIVVFLRSFFLGRKQTIKKKV